MHRNFLYFKLRVLGLIGLKHAEIHSQRILIEIDLLKQEEEKRD